MHAWGSVSATSSSYAENLHLSCSYPIQMMKVSKTTSVRDETASTITSYSTKANPLTTICVLGQRDLIPLLYTTHKHFKGKTKPLKIKKNCQDLPWSFHVP